METTQPKLGWKCSTSIRICHADLNPDTISKMLGAIPEIAQQPGESKIPHGNSRSAGYWCLQQRTDAPNRPHVARLWAEEFIQQRESQFFRLLKDGCDVNIYVGIFPNVLALGFNLPPTPTIWKLGIPVELEVFSR